MPLKLVLPPDTVKLPSNVVKPATTIEPADTLSELPLPTMSEPTLLQMLLELSNTAPTTFTALSLALILPPFAFRVTAPKLTCPPPVASESGLNTIFNSPMDDEMPAFKLMLLWAFKVKVAFTSEVIVIASLTVISPKPMPVPDV